MSTFDSTVHQDSSKARTVTVYLTNAEWSQLAEAAQMLGVARNTLITKALRSALNPKKGKSILNAKRIPKRKSRSRSNY